ncbi:MAG: Nif3-like dinuclear metal center hexameric protein [Flavobacteriaceae bacterium]
MIIKAVTDLLEALAPLENAEEFDNVGLLVGNSSEEVTGILVTLDTLEEVVDEAISKNCNLIISFHPIIFDGLKRLNGSNYVERAVIKAIKNEVAIYTMHTALDNSPMGVNAGICGVLGIENAKILIPKTGVIKKLSTYVPVSSAENLKEALFKAGAGRIGHYSHCSFTVEGSGTFKASDQANPNRGKKGEIHLEKEAQIHLTYAMADENKILKALFDHHPYEEVAYEVYSLDNQHQYLGMGMVGVLREAMDEADFIKNVKSKMNVPMIRHSRLMGNKVQKIAVVGGSGAFAIEAAKKAGADVLLTSDIKYHQFFSAENQIVLLDIGHYESEQFTKNLLADYLKKKMPNFAISLSEVITNPINYS